MAHLALPAAAAAAALFPAVALVEQAVAAAAAAAAALSPAVALVEQAVAACAVQRVGPPSVG